MQAACQLALTLYCVDMSIRNANPSSSDSEDQQIGVLFVCLRNICRSPLAEGLFRRSVQAAGVAERFFIDSSGTSPWHVGQPPDPGSIAVAAKHGIDISMQRARNLREDDGERFHWVVCLDASNKRVVGARIEPKELFLLRDVDPLRSGTGVPDPYGGSSQAFDECFEIIERCMEPLLERVLQVKKLSV